MLSHIERAVLRPHFDASIPKALELFRLGRGSGSMARILPSARYLCRRSWTLRCQEANSSSAFPCLSWFYVRQARRHSILVSGCSYMCAARCIPPLKLLWLFIYLNPPMKTSMAVHLQCTLPVKLPWLLSMMHAICENCRSRPNTTYSPHTICCGFPYMIYSTRGICCG